MSARQRILVLSDDKGSGLCANLGRLYPEQVTVKDFTSEEVGLEGADFVVTQVVKGSSVDRLDFQALRRFAEGGGQVVCCLFEYAHANGLQFSKTYLAGPEHPMIRIKVANDITRGFGVGDALPWHGQVSGAPNAPNQFWQRQVLDVRESGARKIIATSTVNGGAVILEEKVGAGRIVAMDLRSPQEPFFDSISSTNKYLFVGNIIGGSVQYGRHYPRKLGYDEFLAQAEQLSRALPSVRLRVEGTASDGRPLVSLNVGKEGSAAFLFTGSVHGWEWEAPYGLLRLAELLGEEAALEGLPAEGYFARIVPIVNPFGYDHDMRQNANGVDLNRNFDCGWDEYHSREDMPTPWDFDYKGPGAASEPETQVLQAILGQHPFLATVDFHTAHFTWEVAFPCDEGLTKQIHDEVKMRLRNRFLCQQWGTGWYQYEQVNLDPVYELREPPPMLVAYSAARGTPAPILIELSGNRSDTHGLVMNTETVVQICLAAMRVSLAR